MIFISSYNRPKMLMDLLIALDGEDITVIDDGSDYNFKLHARRCNYIRTKHRGKRGYWITFLLMFNIARDLTDCNEYIFIPDDITDFDINRLRADAGNQGNGFYAINILNIDRGTPSNWGVPIEHGYIDCAFYTNRRTLQKLQFKILPVPERRFKDNPNISSGVGRQLTRRMFRLGIKMIVPERSYARHGDHPSVMNPSERLINPQITR
jgi:hypothetical protein